MRGLLIGITVLVGSGCLACAGNPPPVRMEGPQGAIKPLVGTWAGEYGSEESGRSGSIRFELTALGDTARGDVVMIPEGWGRALQPVVTEGPPGEVGARRGPQPEVLTIEFVRVADALVSGRLAPYRDPVCGCTLRTTFRGTVRGDVIEGSYVSQHLEGGEVQHGHWRVQRQR